jgi:hypothetical protein
MNINKDAFAEQVQAASTRPGYQLTSQMITNHFGPSGTPTPSVFQVVPIIGGPILRSVGQFVEIRNHRKGYFAMIPKQNSNGMQLTGK